MSKGYWFCNELVRVVMDGDTSFGGIRALRRGAEREKLGKLGVLAKKLASELRTLDPQVLIFVKKQSAQVFPLQYHLEHRDMYRLLDRRLEAVEDERIAEELSEIFWDALETLDSIVEQIAPAVNRDIDAAPEAGRRDVVSVVVVDNLREIWESLGRKGPAPESITDAGEFSNFLAEAFEALGLQGNCRAAVDSWREYSRKNHNGWFT